MENVSLLDVFGWYPWIPFVMVIFSSSVVSVVVYMYRTDMESTIKKYIALTSLFSICGLVWTAEPLMYILGTLHSTTIAQRFLTTTIIIAIAMMDRDTWLLFKNLFQVDRPAFNTKPLEQQFIFDDEDDPYPSFEEGLI